MKVAFATYDASEDIGGVSTWMQRVLPLLQGTGVAAEVHMMAFDGQPGTNCTYFQERGIPVRWIPWQQHLPYAVRAFLRFLEQGQPDVYVPNCIVPAYFAAGYARGSGIPTVGVLHSDDLFHWGIVVAFIKGGPGFGLSHDVPVSPFLESVISPIAMTPRVAVPRIGCVLTVPKKSTQAPEFAFRLVSTERLIEEQKRKSDVAVAPCKAVRRKPNFEAWMKGQGPANKAVEGTIQE